MGCTSSASNVAESQTSTTDNLENNLMSSAESDKENKTEKTDSQVQQKIELELMLPESENLSNQTQIAKNNNIPAPDKSNSDMDTKDLIQVFNPTVTNINTDNTSVSAPLQLEDSFLSLKDVVERIIIDNVEAEEQKIIKEEEIQNADIDRHIEETIVESIDSNGDESNDEVTKESTSPAQSEDSRATRWEALADIAAELPPSLAVDPLTGQIYSLTK